MNKALLVGNLGNDPDIRSTSGGSYVLTLRVATKDREKVGDTWQDVTEWHSVVVWGHQAQTAAKYLRKGSQVAVEGRIRTRKWQDKEGKDHYTTEIQATNVEFLGGRERGERTERSQGGQYGQSEEVPF